jgi:hypothetical protein
MNLSGFLVTNKSVRYTVAALAVTTLVVLLGGGWYFSDVLEEDALAVDNDPDDFTLTITDISDDTITLEHLPHVEEDENLQISATWGVSNGQAYGQLGDVVAESDGRVTREHSTLNGTFSVGDNVYLDRSSFPHDPLLAHGLDYTEVLIPGPIGAYGAWYVKGKSSLWAILVHGRTDNRDSSIKLIDDLHRLGIHSLTIDYRNDQGGPPSESGYYDFGLSEWVDVEAAVGFALDNGAEKILLAGYSMGGGIVVNYQLQSELAVNTIGIILEAPMLNFAKTVDKGAAERSVPAPVTFVAKTFSTIRFKVDWNGMDFLARADELTVPILLIHGDADDTVPVETSVEFASKLPELTELHTFANAGHVASWNLYTQEYERLVADFVKRIR